MQKALVLAAIILVTSLPALAKPNDTYPVSCDVLWSAVKSALGNPLDYKVLGISDYDQKATFLVVGELNPSSGAVALTGQDKACAMKLTINQIGSDNSDERGFLNRVKKSLVKLQAAKPAKPPTAPGQ